jgi:hypothetical protein
MSAHDVKLFGDHIAASRLESRFARLKATSLLRLAIEDLYPGRIALVSSFGAEAAALLHTVSRVDPARPALPLSCELDDLSSRISDKRRCEPHHGGRRPFRRRLRGCERGGWRQSSVSFTDNAPLYGRSAGSDI